MSQDEHAPEDGWNSDGASSEDTLDSGSDAAHDALDDDADDGEPDDGERDDDDGDSGGSRRGRSDEIEPRDERARMALDFVVDIVAEMEMDCRVRLKRPREGSAEDEIYIEISGRDAGRIIGKKGQVLQALQFLTHRVINRPGIERRHVLVDAEGYLDRRDSSLASMARRLGKQAVTEGKIITFEPMNPRDRRVVHMALAKFEGVITKSDGEGDQRRVQIIPVRRPGSSSVQQPD
jgi:spoIIIJ-associated protein